MLRLDDLVVGVRVDDKEAINKIRSVGNEVESTNAKTSKLGAVGKKLGTLFKVGAVAAVAGVTAMGKTALDAYANFEQLRGGVEKIFGDEAAKMIMKNSQTAYARAGMSANAYLDKVTSLSGALVRSLDGDQKMAAKYADQLMVDISDMANTYGQSVEEVSDTIQSLFRGNYQTLDNLWGGMYAGTKAGMQQMIDDANEYAKAQGLAADLTIDSQADIAKAIEYTNQKWNVSGTTAKEAAETIEGSMNMVKASWENLVTGMMDEEADIDKLVDNFSTSLGNMLSNVGPRIGQFIKTLPKALSGLVDTLVPVFTDMINSACNALPGMISSLVVGITKLFDGIGKAMPGIMSSVGSLIKSLAQQLPSLAGSLVKGVIELVKGIADALPDMVGDLRTGVVELLNALADVLPSLVDSLGAGLTALIEAIGGILSEPTQVMAMLQAMFRLFVAVFKALVGLVPTIIKTFITTVIEFITKGLVGGAKNVAKKFIDAMIKGMSSLKDKMSKKMKEAVDKAKEKIDGIKSKWDGLKLKAKSLAINITAKMSDFVKWVLNKIKAGGKFIANIGKSGDTSGIPQHRIGLQKVPYDNYVASLHKGEVVLTAAEAHSYEKMINGMDKRINQSRPTVINFNGNYNFRDRDDINYFMKEAGKLTRRRTGVV